MGSNEFALNINMNVNGLNPYLPHIAGVIEILEEATFADIVAHIETDLGRKISATDINAGLINGINLGLFSQQREFKVCREFSTKELQKVKTVGDHLTSNSGQFNSVSSTPMDKHQKNVMDYVRRKREERKKKLFKKKLFKRKRNHRLGNKDNYQHKNELSKYLCQRCKKSLEKEFMADSSSLNLMESLSDDNMRNSHSSTVSDSTLSCSRTSSRDGHMDDGGKPEKSRLLIAKNPLETEPPYYDIFT